METITISKENAEDILQYCQDLVVCVQQIKPCFNWNKLEVIKDILAL